jgi:hypothetical protein
MRAIAAARPRHASHPSIFPSSVPSCGVCRLSCETARIQLCKFPKIFRTVPASETAVLGIGSNSAERDMSEQGQLSRPAPGIATSIFGVLNLAVSVATLVMLYFFQVPLFSADKKLKELDGAIRAIDLSTASQKNKMDLFRGDIGAADAAMKLMEDIYPKPTIRFSEAKINAEAIEITWSVENRGQYSLNSDDNPLIVFSLKPVDANNFGESDPNIKVISQTSAIGLLAPKDSRSFTVYLANPNHLSKVYWGITIRTVSSPHVLQLAKTFLPESYATHLNTREVQNTLVGYVYKLQ